MAIFGGSINELTGGFLVFYWSIGSQQFLKHGFKPMVCTENGGSKPTIWWVLGFDSWGWIWDRIGYVYKAKLKSYVALFEHAASPTWFLVKGDQLWQTIGGRGTQFWDIQRTGIGLISLVYQLYPSYIWDIPSYIWDIPSFIWDILSFFSAYGS